MCGQAVGLSAEARCSLLRSSARRFWRRRWAWDASSLFFRERRRGRKSDLRRGSLFMASRFSALDSVGVSRFRPKM